MSSLSSFETNVEKSLKHYIFLFACYSTLSGIFKSIILCPIKEMVTLIMLKRIFKRTLLNINISLFGCYLQVSIDIENKNEWKECFSVKGVRLPTGYYFGATATTGELAGTYKSMYHTGIRPQFHQLEKRLCAKKRTWCALIGCYLQIDIGG